MQKKECMMSVTSKFAHPINDFTVIVADAAGLGLIFIWLISLKELSAPACLFAGDDVAS